MPITKSAKKSLRVSRKKERQNEIKAIALEKALKKVNKDNVNNVVSLVDKAAKTGLFHKNKAARMKSALAKKFGTPAVSKETAKETKKTVKEKPKTVKKESKK